MGQQKCKGPLRNIDDTEHIIRVIQAFFVYQKMSGANLS